MRSNPQNIEFKDYGEDKTYSSESEVKNKSDVDIWAAFKEGDESAFIYIYRQYANLLFNYGAKFSDDRELVKDCLQDFFIYLRSAREKLGDTNSIKLYLLKSFRRRVIDYIVKSDNEKQRNKNVVDFQLKIEISHELKYINAQVQEKQVLKLKQALDSLNKNEKEAVYHFYYEGMTYKEIADLMGFSHVSSARRLIYRALYNLKDLFILLLLTILSFNISY